MKKGAHKSLKELLDNKYTVDNTTGCWVIKRKDNKKNRYGRLKIYVDSIPKYIGMHQASYLVYKGNITDGMWVLHKCNNSHCCNPEHLYLGTRQDNERDKANSGIMKGGNHPHTNLSNEQVKEIKELILVGKTNGDIAKLYKVRKLVISKIRCNKTWVHI